MQNLGTPRFYISLNEYLNSIGGLDVSSSEGQDVSSIGFLNPSNPITISTPSGADIDFTFSGATSFLSNDKGYFAILGHNFATQSSEFFITDPEGIEIAETEIINSAVTGDTHRTADHDGFTIFSCNYGAFDSESSGIRLGLTGSPNIGCVSFGNFYDMPHSPDLKLKMSIKMDGVTNITTKGGSTLSNAMYAKPADWGDRGAWQLGNDADGNPFSNFRSGRRSWDLSFSFLSSESVMPANAGTSLSSGGAQDDFETNILDGTDFFSQVWSKTLGNALPFIFQPNAPKYDATGTQIAGNNNPDQFAICKFDMKSLKITQRMHRKYSVKIKIEEVW